MSKAALDLVTKRFAKSVKASHAQHGDETVVVDRAIIHELAAFLRDEPALAFEMLSDITAVDYLGHKEPRFEVVYHFLSLSKRHRLRVKVPLAEDALELDTLCELYPSANWAEREVFDMYGIRFAKHPDLRRILMYEEFEGYPLRKDYPLHGSQPRIDLLDVERPNTNMYSPNFGEYGPAKENR